MARYIDVEALMKELGIADDCDNCAWNGEGKCMKGEGFADACVAMEDAPTADVVERTKGGWKYDPNDYDDLTWECSVCTEPWTLIEGTPRDNNMNFCPNCGADMRGEE